MGDDPQCHARHTEDTSPIDTSNQQSAIGKLEAFIHEVEAQRDKKILGTDADKLIADALAIIELLEGQLSELL